MSLTTTLKLSLRSLLVGPLDLSNSINDLQLAPEFTLADGAGINAANLVYQDTVTLAAAGETLLDLTALTDALGSAVNFARVKLIYLRNKSATAGDNLQLGGTVSAGLSTLYVGTNAGQLIGPGGIALLVNPSAAGWAVTATTADILRIGNPGANSITYDIVLIGAAT
jgi:hypothetical protein